MDSDSGLDGWGERRFSELFELCTSEEIIEVFCQILRDGTLDECQNAALLLNFYVLEECYRISEESYQWEGKNWTKRCDEWRSIREQFRTKVDLFSLHEWGPKLELMQTFIQKIPQVLPASQLEGFLRTLRIFESLFVVEPLAEVSVFLLKNTDEDGQNIWQNLDRNLQLDNLSSTQVTPLGEAVVMLIFSLWWRLDYNRISGDHIAFVKWSLFELRQLINRLRDDIIRQMDDPLQRIEAAKAVVRLYIEELWNRDQLLGEWVPEIEQRCTTWLSRPGLTPEHIVWPDGATLVYRYRMKKRIFASFMEACPNSPLEHGGRPAIEFLENKLAYKPRSEEFNRAARLLIDHFREYQS